MAGSVMACKNLGKWHQVVQESTSNDSLYVVHFDDDTCDHSVTLAEWFTTNAPQFDSVFFLRVDVNPLKSVVEEFRVGAFPTVLFMKQGNEVDRVDKMTHWVPPYDPFNPGAEQVEELIDQKLQDVLDKTIDLDV